MDNALATTAFPTAATVPFPFASPYTVQTELMAALVDALRRHDDRDDHGLVANQTKRRVPIIMMKIPTGTGESLSLACASLA